jgi:cysteine desulfurase
MIYLDYQATTPLAPEALDAMLPWLRDGHANPHSAHRPGRAAKAAVEVARGQIAPLLPPGGRIAFTSGATEALNWAIKGSTGPIVTLATEHAAVLDTVAAETARGRAVTVLPVGPDGLVDLEHAHAAIVPGTGLVAAMLVNNEIGVIQPIAALADLAHAAGALFLCDAVQGYGRVPIPANVDLVAISAHKVHGPKGIGALWLRDGVQLTPLLHGGDQEGGRSGTLSPALCAGFGVAARLMGERAEADRDHVERLWQLATDRFGLQVPLPLAGEARGGDVTPADGFPTSPPPTPPASGRGEWRLNGSRTQRYPGNLNLRFPGLDVARLMSDLRDLAFSAGSACASGSGRPSHVLKAIGLSDAEARASIRLGFGRYTTETELSDALTRIDAAARAQRA